MIDAVRDLRSIGIEGEAPDGIGPICGPEPQDLRDGRIGNVIVNNAVDRPWSTDFKCDGDGVGPAHSWAYLV